MQRVFYSLSKQMEVLAIKKILFQRRHSSWPHCLGNGNVFSLQRDEEHGTVRPETPLFHLQLCCFLGSFQKSQKKCPEMMHHHGNPSLLLFWIILLKISILFGVKGERRSCHRWSRRGFSSPVHQGVLCVCVSNTLGLCIVFTTLSLHNHIKDIQQHNTSL